MGFNTALIVLNDHLNDLERDTQTGEKLSRLIQGKGYSDHVYMSGVDCLPSVHADGTQIVAIGQNSINLLTVSFARSNDEKALLKDFADHLGYRLVKKGKKS